MFATGGDGDRGYALALMQANPQGGDLDCILDAISDSHSAFEQGQALRTALELLPRMNSRDKGRLSTVVQDQLGPDGHLRQPTERQSLAKQVLIALAGGNQRFIGQGTYSRSPSPAAWSGVSAAGLVVGRDGEPAGLLGHDLPFVRSELAEALNAGTGAQGSAPEADYRFGRPFGPELAG